MKQSSTNASYPSILQETSGMVQTKDETTRSLSWGKAVVLFWNLLPYLFLFIILIGIIVVIMVIGICYIDRLDIAKRTCEYLKPYASVLPWLVVSFFIGFLLLILSHCMDVSWLRRNVKRIAVKNGEIEFQDQESRLDPKDMAALSDDIVGQIEKRIRGICNVEKDASKTVSPKDGDFKNENTSDKNNGECERTSIGVSEQPLRTWERYHMIESFVLKKHGEDIGAELIGRNIRSPDGRCEFDGIYKTNVGIIVAEIKILQNLSTLERLIPNIVARFSRSLQTRMFRGSMDVSFHVIAAMPDMGASQDNVQDKLAVYKQRYPDIGFFVVQYPEP